MTIRSASRVATAFLLAVMATAILASIVQTQFNLSALTALGAPVSMGVRAVTTAQDVAYFGPVMAAITAAGFLPAFAIAWLLSLLWPESRVLLHTIAGAIALWAAFQLMGFVTPMPTLVAAARTTAGLVALSAMGLVGGLLFALASRPRLH